MGLPEAVKEVAVVVASIPAAAVFLCGGDEDGDGDD